MSDSTSRVLLLRTCNRFVPEKLPLVKQKNYIHADKESSPTGEPPDSWESRNWNDPYEDAESPTASSSTDYHFKMPNAPPSRYERSDSDDSEQEEDSGDIDR